MPINHHHKAPTTTQAAAPAAGAAGRQASPTPRRDTPRTQTPARTTNHAAASFTKLPAGLRADCADGHIDHPYGAGVITRALGIAGNGGGEYGSCQAALAQAALQHP